MTKDSFEKKVIAFDGTAGSGKGTIGRLIAEKLGYDYLDTGLMFRKVAESLLVNRVQTTEVEKILLLINKIDFQDCSNTKKLSSNQIGELASKIAVISQVRSELSDEQKKIVQNSKKERIIVDGRDIGSVVFPNALCKFYFDATLEERAKRRFNQLQKKGKNIKLQEVYNYLNTRDLRDKKRSIAPLKKDSNYIEINTTSSTVPQVLNKVMKLIKNN